MSRTFDEGLLEHLAPSLGFFGGSNLDRLDVAVGCDVASLRVYIDASDPGYLNLRGIEFRDEQGPIELSEGTFSIHQSSVQKGNPARTGAALLRKKGIHSAKELRPSWEISFDQPISVHQVRIFNRSDAYAVRSRTLVVEVAAPDGKRFEVFRAQSRENLDKALRAVKRTLAIEPPELDRLDPESAYRWRTRVLEELAARARHSPDGISPKAWRELIAFTPAWVHKDASDLELLVYAGFLLAQRSRMPSFATSVKLLAPALGSKAALQRLDGAINELASLHQMDAVMLTRHGLRPVGLLRRNSPAFLAHMRKTMAVLKACGYPAVIAYGTLLGAVRDGRFIAHDDDLDVMYRAASSTRAGAELEVQALARKLVEAGYKVVDLLPKHLNMHVIDSVTGISLDVFPCWLEGGKMQMHMEGMAIRGIAPDIMFPESIVQLEGEDFPAPAVPARFLAERYGDGWNVPDMYYDWPWPLKVDRELRELSIKLPQHTLISRAEAKGRNTTVLKDEEKVLTTKDGKIAVHWWTHAPNFGDLLAPWLVEKMSGREVGYAPKNTPGYVVIGSILSHVTDGCVVWGAGSFGTETASQICANATYLAVRGPLTRNKLDNLKIPCPRVYGDPALLVPDYYKPDIEKTHEVGVVLRWSETERNDKLDIPGVKKIFLGSDDIEGTIDEMLSCKRIVSSSLHGLILADAYGIPNAWLDSPTPKGKEFKYWDYLLSVDKPRPAKAYKLIQPGLTVDKLIADLHFDDRPIKIDLDLLRDACPFKQ